MTHLDHTSHQPLMGKRHWFMLSLALVLSALVCFGFGDLRPLPGIGVTGLTLLFLPLSLWALGKNSKPNPLNIAMLALALLLGLCFGLYANENMRLLNLPILYALFLLGLYDLSGALPEGLGHPRSILRIIRLWFKDAFDHFLSPFRHIAASNRQKPAHFRGVVLGLLFSLPLLVLTAKNSLPVRVLSLLLLAMTCLILASAAWRMGLYIQAFGLSLLRLLTLWAMAMILLLLLCAALLLFRPGLQLFEALLCLVLSSWVALNLLNPAGLVAQRNARAYLSGSLSQLDQRYLAVLSADTLPALRQLLPPDAYQVTQGILQQKEAPPWYAWSASYLFLN